ncbi:MAG: phosphoribosylaminoimidazolesuccinocarboxamide synthase [Anaerovoracaceae bacterium]
MKLIYKGKTKNVYELDNGNCLLQFKDDATGENGVFDPGANQVGLTIAGMGKAGLQLTTYFFEKLEELGIPTHYVSSDLDAGTMTVKKATFFGQGLEVICRYRAVGSFLRRYGKYATDGQPLDGLVEITLKDDERNDPLITEDALEMLGILSKEEYKILKDLTKKISGFIKSELANKGLELYDIKLEFGKVGEEGQIALIDEISGGNMRVYEGDRKIDPLELGRIMC